MRLPKSKPSKDFYFFSSSVETVPETGDDPKHYRAVLIESSKVNDDDNCGYRYITYKTKAKTLKKGDQYYDRHGVAQICGTDNYQAQCSTGEIDNYETAEHLPFIRIQAHEVGNTENTLDEYYWLDNYIEDGDFIAMYTQTGTQLDDGMFRASFHNKPKNVEYEAVGTNGYGNDYGMIMLAEVEGELKKDINKGMSMDNIKRKYPYYLFVDYANTFELNNIQYELDEFTLNGSGVTSTDLNIGSVTFNDMKLKRLVAEVVNEQAVNFVGEKLKKYDFHLQPYYSPKEDYEVENGPVLVGSFMLRNKDGI